MSETTKPEELFETLVSEFLASGQEIDEYVKSKLAAKQDLFDDEGSPADGAEWAERLITTFAEIDSNHESLLAARKDGLTRAEWLDEKLGDIVQTVASGDKKRKTAEEIMARIFKTLIGVKQEDAKCQSLHLDDNNRSETANLIETAIVKKTNETFATKTESKKKENT